MQAIKDSYQLEEEIRRQFEVSYTQKLTDLYKHFQASIERLDKAIYAVFDRIK